jgi:hypothetical protein
MNTIDFLAELFLQGSIDRECLNQLTHTHLNLYYTDQIQNIRYLESLVTLYNSMGRYEMTHS